jgi:hypothetical protein
MACMICVYGCASLRYLISVAPLGDVSKLSHTAWREQAGALILRGSDQKQGDSSSSSSSSSSAKKAA